MTGKSSCHEPLTPDRRGRAMTGDRKLTLVLAMATLFILLSYFHSVVRMSVLDGNFGDFANYYFYTQQIQSGVNVYAVPQAQMEERIRQSDLPAYICYGVGYSPLFFFLFSPLTRLDFPMANLLWLILNHLLLAVILALAWRMSDARRASDLFLLLILMFASQPLAENVGIGQINIVILFFLVLMALGYGRERMEWLCGPLLGFILLLKPQFGVLLLFFLWKRSYGAVLATLLAYLLFRAAGILVYGLPVEVAYWTNLHALSGIETLHLNSLKVVLQKVFGSAASERAWAGGIYASICLLLTGATFLRMGRRRMPDKALQEYALVICLILLISPVTEEHHLVFMFIPFVALLHAAELHVRSGVLLAAAFCLISVRYSLNRFPVFQSGLPALLNAAKLLGVFIVWEITRRSLPPARPGAILQSWLVRKTRDGRVEGPKPAPSGTPGESLIS